ncbi:UbiX family flavin prenyltransferase [Desulfosporosinus sp. BICA1-9]|uniref:UbiX family flavin prenyltransferase n=1 Tax=Desulfosporosinus sp. BICA1-9 TaxID=1531958 RepID=UPI00054C46BC|nr:flavin prenyltransferase UbiX [Desulfosporosinus sp. BICA1-9]KJS84247.1 MAG: aromatic acid decarboxylase [Desulfosporosinus sp. BICA1-9]HBW37675.1 UbiX family flavin prenyltransferase [Desulfosporosinus sp.]
MTKRIVVGITGASGSIYAYTLIETLAAMGWDVEVILTQIGEKVLAYECGVEIKAFSSGIHVHAIDDLFSSLASGSFRNDGMVVIPCSMNTLGLLANGIGDNLLARAAQVMLKERRPLVVVPREMPYNIIHLENMLRLARAGGIILPASPGFYHHPQSMDDLVRHVVGRVLDQLGIEHTLYKRWEGVLT